MAPKSLSDKVTIGYDTLKHLLMTNLKLVERLAWKAMDAEEYTEHFSVLMRGLAKETVKISRLHVRQALVQLKAKLSPAELDLFVEKLAGAIAYIKRRLRDAGSGVHLPATCVAVNKLWHRYHAKKKKASSPSVSAERSASTTSLESAPSTSAAVQECMHT